MSAADDNTTRPPLTPGSTWVQLCRDDQTVGFPIEIVEATRNVTHLTELVKGKRAVALHNFDAADLAVYPHGTLLNALNNTTPLARGGSVPGGTTEARPLMVIAPGKCF
jgi:hypothetical protein